MISLNWSSKANSNTMWKLGAEKQVPFFVASGDLVLPFMQAVKGHSLAWSPLISGTLTVQHACCELRWVKERESYHFWLIGAGSHQSTLIKTDEVPFTFFSFSAPKYIFAVLLQTTDAKSFSQSTLNGSFRRRNTAAWTQSRCRQTAGLAGQ